MKSVHWPTHWEVFWYFRSRVEILFLLSDLTELIGISASEKTSQFWPTFWSQELIQTSGKEHQNACSWLSGQMFFSPPYRKEFRKLTLHHRDFACLLWTVPHFCIICLAIVNPSFGLSIFGTVFIYLFLQGNIEFITKSKMKDFNNLPQLGLLWLAIPQNFPQLFSYFAQLSEIV